jgi:hypothetical protein
MQTITDVVIIHVVLLAVSFLVLVFANKAAPLPSLPPPPSTSPFPPSPSPPSPSPPQRHTSRQVAQLHPWVPPGSTPSSRESYHCRLRQWSPRMMRRGCRRRTRRRGPAMASSRKRYLVLLVPLKQSISPPERKSSRNTLT